MIETISFAVFAKLMLSAIFIGAVIMICYFKQSTKALRHEVIQDTVSEIKLLVSELEKGYLYKPHNEFTIPEMYRELNYINDILLDVSIAIKSLMFIDRKVSLLSKPTRMLVMYDASLYVDFVESRVKAVKAQTRLFSRSGEKTMPVLDSDVTSDTMDMVISKFNKIIVALEDELK